MNCKNFSKRFKQNSKWNSSLIKKKRLNFFYKMLAIHVDEFYRSLFFCYEILLINYSTKSLCWHCIVIFCWIFSVNDNHLRGGYMLCFLDNGCGMERGKSLFIDLFKRTFFLLICFVCIVFSLMRTMRVWLIVSSIIDMYDTMYPQLCFNVILQCNVLFKLFSILQQLSERFD